MIILEVEGWYVIPTREIYGQTRDLNLELERKNVTPSEGAPFFKLCENHSQSHACALCVVKWPFINGGWTSALQCFCGYWNTRISGYHHATRDGCFQDYNSLSLELTYSVLLYTWMFIYFWHMRASCGKHLSRNFKERTNLSPDRLEHQFCSDL